MHQRRGPENYEEYSVSQSLIHTLADVQTAQIGTGTRVWQFVVVLPGAKIGEDCNSCSHCLIENDVVVGDRVTVKSGVQLWDGLRVGDDVFIGPNVTFTNDKFPRSKQYRQHFANTVVMAGASIGGGATSGHNDWRARHSGGRCSGNSFSAGRSHRCRQSGTHRWVGGARS